MQPIALPSHWETPQSIVNREVSIYGTCASSGEYPACIDLLKRQAIRVEPLITAKASLAQSPDGSLACTPTNRAR